MGIHGWLVVTVAFITGATLAQSSAPGTGFADALKTARIKADDSVDTKIGKSLFVLNDKGFLFKDEGKYKPNYDADYMRTVEELFDEKEGGGCGATGRALSAMLIASGIPEDNIRIVSTVVNDELKSICPKKDHPARREHKGLSGHVFVLVKDENGKWFLINSTSGAREKEMVPFISPDALVKSMAGPVQVPKNVYASLMEDSKNEKIYRSGMTIFGVWKPSQLPRHQFIHRTNLVASGAMGNEVCRYDAAMVNHTMASQGKTVVKRDSTLQPTDTAGFKASN